MSYRSNIFSQKKKEGESLHTPVFRYTAVNKNLNDVSGNNNHATRTSVGYLNRLQFTYDTPWVYYNNGMKIIPPITLGGLFCAPDNPFTLMVGFRLDASGTGLGTIAHFIQSDNLSIYGYFTAEGIFDVKVNIRGEITTASTGLRSTIGYALIFTWDGQTAIVRSNSSYYYPTVGTNPKAATETITIGNVPTGACIGEINGFNYGMDIEGIEKLVSERDWKGIAI